MIPTSYRRATRWIVVALSGWLVLSGRPAFSDGAQEASRRRGAARAETPCVLLRNGNVLFGRCREQGEWVVVTSGDGSRVRLPRRDVAMSAASLRELYQHRLNQQPRDDLNIHLENARWCLRYNLFDLAAAELRKIYRRDPDHAQAKRIERRLRRQTARPDPAPEPESGTAGRAGEATAEEEPPPEPESRSEPGFDLATLQAFAQQVQPLLINRCGQCHSHTSGRRWRLIVPAGGTRASARMTRENLASLSPYLDLDAALESELLERAIAAHGGAGAPPLGPSEAAAIEGLKSWLQNARSATAPPDDAPEKRSATAPGAAMADGFVEPVRPEWPLAHQGDAPQAEIQHAGRPGSPASPAEPAGDERPRQNQTGQSFKRPARLPPVDNPFDPKLFNRKYGAVR